MRALGGKDPTRRPGGRRTSRPGRGRLAAALLALLMLGCFFGLAAAAGASVPGAAAPDSSAEGLLARLALQQARLIAADGAADDGFGSTVAVSGDTALVGAPFHDTAGVADAGAAYVFTRSGGAWTLQAQLIVGDGAPGDQFGSSVALFGGTALVGAPQHDTAGRANAGAAYVFVRSGDSWALQQKLIAAAGAAGDLFGYYYGVAIFGDTALVGAPSHDSAGQADAGAAYVFTRSGGSWTQQQKLIAADGVTVDQLGSSVAVSGETALVGAPGHTVVGERSAGAAYVFTRSAVAWTQQAELTAAGGAGFDQLGASVALSGETALVGAPWHNTVGKPGVGAAYVFTRSAVAWTQQAELSAAGAGAFDQVGASVALSGETALVGAPYHNTASKVHTGAAYVFTRFGGSWTARDRLIGAAAGDDFGVSVALSGAAALVGAPEHDSAGMANAGAAYIFLSLPAITKLLPASGKRGAFVTISGTDFGAARGTSSVKFGAKKCAQYVSWSATRIKCRVPAQAKYGAVNVTVTTTAGKSNAKRFTVKP